MEEYKSNSHKSRERAKAELPEKKVEKLYPVLLRQRKRAELINLQGYLFQKM